MQLKLVFTLFLALILSAIFIAVRSNNKPEIITVDPAFTKYISGYSSGMMSRNNSIKIELANDLPSNLVQGNNESTPALPDSNLLKKAFSFSPSIKGRAHFTSNRSIEFIPSEPLKEQTLYTATFRLNKLITTESKFSDFKFQFSTYAQNMFVEVGAANPMDAFHIEWQTIEGHVKLSDKEDTAKLFNTITASQEGKKLKLHWYMMDDNNYTFSIDSIARSNKAGMVEVKWDGHLIKAVQSGQSSIAIPALGDFHVTKSEVKEDEHQFVLITFSDPIKSEQDLKGLITLNNNETLSYSVDGNEVSVYLANRIEGTYTLNVFKGVKNFRGYAMNTSYSNSLEFEAPKPALRIQGKGSILPNSQGLFMPFESIGLNAVDVRVIKIYETNVKQFLQVNNLDGNDELKRVGKVIAEQKLSLNDVNTSNLNQWSKHVIDLKKLMTPDPGSIYRVSIKFKKEYTKYDCPETEESNDDEIVETENESSVNKHDDWTEDEWHGYDYDNGYDTWRNYGDDYSPCDHNYYDGKAVSRNILASDIGVIYKLDEDKLAHVYVSNMLTTEPIANSEIEFVDYTRQTIATVSTDAKGMAVAKLSRKPLLVIAKKGAQRGYLKVNDGLANSLSKFDIEGEQPVKGVKGFIYAERGVWRPGDSIYTSFILEDKQHQIPDHHPVKFKLSDPDGAVVYETVSTQGVDHTYDFRCATSYGAKTGNYTASVSIGNSTFTKRIHIETVKPNRLKINCIFPDSVLSEKTKDKPIVLQSRWLHGGIAKQLKVSVDAVISNTETSFKQYKNYVFSSPLRNESSDEIHVFEGPLDDNGNTQFSSLPALSKNVSGFVKATYITKVFEPGGDFSIDRSQVICSPFNTYVGLQVPSNGQHDGALTTNQNYSLNIITVDEKGRAMKGSQLQLRIYKLKWQWWYEHDENDFSDFVTKNATEIVKDSMINLTSASCLFNMKIQDQNWGRYLITVTDLQGGHQAGTTVYFEPPYWNRSNAINNENASMLNFSSNKKTYKKGEKIELTIPSTSKGKALVSIENGNRVLQSEWVTTQDGQTNYSFTATETMAPNIYIHVTYLQPHLNTVNDLPIRMYGIIPVEVVDEATVLHPVIEAASSIRAEENTVIRVHEQSGQKMTYTLAMVDDGLLDLTHFKTPQPWTNFYAKQALGVTTWDMYDQVIGAYSGKLDAMLSIGGDGEYQKEYANKANRFVPVVKFIGPFTLEKGQHASHSIRLPNYVGSVRVMVVAQHEGHYGNAEKEITVKKPLMLLATLPRVFSPTEQIEMPVNIFAMENQIKDVQVTVESNELVRVETNKQSIHFSRVGDEMLNFRLMIANKTGIAKIKVKAVCGNEVAYQELEVEVRVPNPVISKTTDLVIQPGASISQSFMFTGIEGTNSAVIELSTIPSIGLETHLNYLIQYPHGCIEQTTSSVFPQLYVANLSEVNDTVQKQISFNIKRAITRIQLFQTNEGGFSYWPGEGNPSEFGSNYAGHFLLEAEKQGYIIPSAMKANWVKYQKEKARKWSEQTPGFFEKHDEETHQFLQAYRLYTLALNNTPEIGAMNQLREEKNIKPQAKWRLAAAYKLIGQYEVAALLIQNLSLESIAYRELSYGYGSTIRDHAMMLETLSLLKDSRAEQQAQKLIGAFNSGQWMSTQETAYTLLALCKHYQITNTTSNVSAVYSVNNSSSKSISSANKVAKLFLSEKNNPKQTNVNIKNTSSSKLYARVIVSGAPLIGDTTKEMHGVIMSIVYKNNQNQIIQPTHIVQGTDFKAVVTITNTSDSRPLKEMVLSELFPGGWEIHNARMDESETKSEARYQDIRDDRVYTYYDLAMKSTKTFTIQLNASYLGRFYLPAISSEAMYDHAIHASVPGYWVNVVKEGTQLARN